MKRKKNPVLPPRPFCRLCRGEGLVLAKRPDGGGRWMVRCECRIPKSATLEFDFKSAAAGGNE